MTAIDAWTVAADIFDPPADPYADDPVAFVEDVLHFHPWSKQREILEAVRDHPRVAVRACHGVGKTAIAAQCALWFLKTHRGSRVITTAPTFDQVRGLLWNQIRASVARAPDGMFPEAHETRLTLGVGWEAIGRSTDKPERFQGQHAEHLLLIVDEASGVDERIFEAGEGYLTAEGGRLLLIGNPNVPSGQFYRAFSTESAKWRTFHISAFDSPNFTEEQVPPDVAREMPKPGWPEEMAALWGEESVAYQVRVLGNFAAESDDTVCPLGAVEAAQKRSLEPHPDDRVCIGVDVARFGSDETVIAVRHGRRVTLARKFNGNPTTFTAAAVIEEAEKHIAQHTRIVVDDPGVGGGVTDLLRAKDRWPVIAFNGGEKAYLEHRYPNRRSEQWFRMAAELPTLDLDRDQQLLSDLVAPKFKHDERLRRVVERKDRTKERLGRSPDRADAVLLTLVGDDYAYDVGEIITRPAGADTELDHAFGDVRGSGQDINF